MDAQQAYQRLGGYFRSLSPGGRLAVALLFAVALVSAGYLIMQRPARPEVELLPGETLAAEQMPAAEAAFRRAKLADYEIVGTTIRVPRGRESLYKAALAEARIQPTDFGATLRAAVNGGSMFEIGSLREQQRMKIALQETLAAMIRDINGVENAYVIYDIDQRSGLRMEKLLTATVGVKLTAGLKLDAQRSEDIRRMVAGAIAGMKPENVTLCELGDAAPPAAVRQTPPPAAEAKQPPTLADWQEQSWKIYATVGLATVMVAALWLLARGRKPAAPRPSIARVDAGTESAAAVPAPHWNTAAVEAALDHEISELIESDPQAAAEVLRGWLAQAG